MVKIYPITNSTADLREHSGAACPQMSHPSNVTVPSRIGNPINSTAGGFSVSLQNYSYILPKFTHCSNQPLSYSLKLSPNTALPDFITFDAALQVVTISPWNNTKVGTYVLRV